MADANTQRELNRLYWESDASVSDIADRLDISRRALYDGIEPRPAGEACPECGAALVFRNRTALENREASCPRCGFETELDAATPAAERPREPGRPSTPRSGRRTLSEMDTAPVTGTAFLAGLALGALTAYLVQRR